MKRHIVVILILTGVILFIPVGNDVNVNVGLEFKHPVKTQTKATMEQKEANKVMAMKFAKAGYNWDLRQRQCIYKLFTAESRFDHLAKNQQGSSAFGIGQHRYDTPCRAWSHHVSRNWY
jgi:hypothetical protein